MSVRITDQPTFFAQRHLARLTTETGTSMRRLSSGLRISTAADDAAGLAISERLRARIRSLDQARRNATDGISLLRVTEGALGSVSDMLVRMRELAINARNGTHGPTDLKALDTEYQALLDEVARTGEASSFNGLSLLDGSTRTVQLQIGVGTKDDVDTITVTVNKSLPQTLALHNTRLTGGKQIDKAIKRVDRALERLHALRGRFGAVQNRLRHTIADLSSRFESASAAQSRIRDVDVARETALLTRGRILQQTGVTVLAQANAQPAVALRLLS